MPKVEKVGPVETAGTCDFKYDPNRNYTIEEFENINEWLKTNSFEIDKIRISHFECDLDGKLIPIPLTPVPKETTVGEIFRQLSNWNVQTRQNGTCATFQGGSKLDVVVKGKKRSINAPDIAFTPKETYHIPSGQQLDNFEDQHLHLTPAFVVEVEDLSKCRMLEKLTSKFRETYFPAGVKLGWLIDPANKGFYVFKRSQAGTVRRCIHYWYDDDDNPMIVDGGEVLPGFHLKLWKIDEAISQEPLSLSSSSESASEEETVSCSTCNTRLPDYYSLIEHIEDNHARKRHKR